MFDPRKRYAAAKALCASCPVEMRDACLFRALTEEIGQPRRWGVFGGLNPADRRRIDGALGPAEITRRYEASEAALRTALVVDQWTPTPPELRYLDCRGCGSLIRQPRAGALRRFCRSCRKRRNAEIERDRWLRLSEEERQRRRDAMRARWASRTPAQRAEVYRRQRERRAAKRRAAA